MNDAGGADVQHPLGKRIIVVGSSNAGKSTFSALLAGQGNVPYIELDALHWGPGWVEAEEAVFRERIRCAMQTERWVMDGNYLSKQQDVSWPVADTIIWLDLSLPTVLNRCIRRSWRRWRGHELLYGDNREVLWDHFKIWDTDKSLSAHEVRTYRSRRRLLEAATIDPRWSHITFIRLRSVAEVEQLLVDSVLPPAHSDGMQNV